MVQLLSILLLAPVAEVVDHMVAVVVPVHLELQQDFQYQLHQVLIQSLLVLVEQGDFLVADFHTILLLREHMYIQVEHMQQEGQGDNPFLVLLAVMVVEAVVLGQLLVDLHLDQQEVLVVEQEMDIQLVLCQEVQVEHMEILVVQAK
jgi:hypothetical protein